jgi:predicted acyltransferase
MTPQQIVERGEPEAQPIVIHVPPLAPPLPPLPAPNESVLTGVVSLPQVNVELVTPVQTPEPALEVAEPKRASSLDALRGLFLVSMTFGFTISDNRLPLWMYHRQFPPPGDTPVNVVGISWRDLTYVAFLFTMSAALPLTLSRRIDRGEPELAIVFAAIRRYGMLLFFALLMAHSNTYFLGYTQPARVLSIVGFAIMAAVFTRRRKDWDSTRFSFVRRAGWIAAIAFLALSPLTYGRTFAFDRIDDIIVDLAFASFAGSLLWYFTRDHIGARLGFLAVTVALYFGAHADGWLQGLWYSSPASWAFTPSQLSLLCVVIPGTIAGDAVRRWMRSSDESDDSSDDVQRWGNARLVALAAVCVVVTPIFVVGMYTRAVEPATEIILALLAAGIVLTRQPANMRDRMLRSMFAWGALWLTIGLFLEPAEGGIKKVPETLTYFFSVTGVTSLLLVAMTVITDGIERRGWVHALIDVGQNPLLGYVLFTVLLNPLLELIPPLRPVLMSSPAESVIRSLIETVMVVVAVRFVTHRRVFWRT